MPLRTASAVALVLCLVAPFARADEKDFLAPLVSAPTPTPPKRAQGRSAPLVERDASSEDSQTQLWVKLPPGMNATRARLTLDGRPLAAFPSGPTALAAGEHHVLVQRPDQPDYSRFLMVHRFTTHEVMVPFDIPAAKLAVFSIDGAEIFIDGYSIGPAPLRDLVLTPGVYEIRVVKTGYDEEVKWVPLRAGKEVAVSFHLLPTLPSGPGRVAATRVMDRR